MPRGDRNRSRRIVPWGIVLGGLLSAATARAGGSEALLAMPVHAVWHDVPLRDWAARLTATGSATGAAVVIDRRLDPTAPVTGDSRGEPLLDVAERVAATIDAAVEVLDSIVLLVPQDRAGAAAGAEAARRRELSRLPAARRRPLEAREPSTWPAGATPRDVVAAAARAAGLRVQGLDLVPHDHLAVASLPPLDLAARLDLVLASDDLRVRWGSDGAGQIVAIDAGVDATAPPPRPRRPAAVPAPAGEPRFTLRLAAPLDEAVSALAGRFALEATIDEASLAARGIQPGEVVRLEVRDATRDELFDALVAPLRLRWRIEGTRLTIDAAPP